MGFRISWLAAQGLKKSSLLEHFGFEDTHLEDEANEAPFSVAELQTGWTVLWSNDPTFANIERAANLSRLAPVISCWVNETVMLSSANYFEQGNYLWFVGHDAQKGMYDLQFEGNLPEQFDEISGRLRAQQDIEGGEKTNVDFIFDVPLELAQALCGFKHDLGEYDWGTPEFSEVRSRAKNETPVATESRGWLSRLLGRA